MSNAAIAILSMLLHIHDAPVSSVLLSTDWCERKRPRERETAQLALQTVFRGFARPMCSKRLSES